MCKSTWPLAGARGCHHGAVIIPLYMYLTVSLTQLLLYFRKKLTVLILLMSSSFCLLYTSPVNNAM